MSDQGQSATSHGLPGSDHAFAWHPRYGGRSFKDVHEELVRDIARDQRSYKLAMDGAEGAEHDSLTTIVELERRWSTYEFDWAETEPEQLADRIVKFEQECERRQETLSFADYRASGALVSTVEASAPEPTRSLPIMQIGGAILAVLVIFFIIAIVT